MVHCVSEADIDAKLPQLQAISPKKGEKIIHYSNRILGLVGELESAVHDMSAVE